jgi:hypothetical protein
METIPSKFIDEPIDVLYDIPPTYEKCPDCPSGFIWRGQTYMVTELLSEQQDHSRRGRSARNMQPAHLQMALRNGSWGVGRYCFIVRVESGQIFEIYYDRAPENAGDRKGHWILKGERAQREKESDKV